jgi:type II secretory ATPase GspE/PulE/Tfp pilus assembly ATPase PilB-like protein
LINNNELKDAFGVADDSKIDSILLYKGEGCKVCAGTGYKDRVGIFEILEVDDAVREAIVKNSSSQQIKQVAFKDGKNPILIDGAKKVLNGVTTLAELFRAI